MVLQFSSLFSRLVTKVCGSIISLLTLSVLFSGVGYGQDGPVFMDPMVFPVGGGSHGTVIVSEIITVADIFEGEGEEPVPGSIINGSVSSFTNNDPNCPGTGGGSLRFGVGPADGTVVYPNLSSVSMSSLNPNLSNIVLENGQIAEADFIARVPGAPLPPGTNPLWVQIDGDRCSFPEPMQVGMIDNQSSDSERTIVSIHTDSEGLVLIEEGGFGTLEGTVDFANGDRAEFFDLLDVAQPGGISRFGEREVPNGESQQDLEKLGDSANSQIENQSHGESDHTYGFTVDVYRKDSGETSRTFRVNVFASDFTRFSIPMTLSLSGGFTPDAGAPELLAARVKTKAPDPAYLNMYPLWGRNATTEVFVQVDLKDETALSPFNTLLFIDNPLELPGGFQPISFPQNVKGDWSDGTFGATLNVRNDINWPEYEPGDTLKLNPNVS